MLLSRFDPEERAHLLVRQSVDVAVRTLPYIAETLVQNAQEHLTADVFELAVQNYAFQVAKTSVITSKPAICYHFKTGQRDHTQDQMMLYRAGRHSGKCCRV